MFRYVIALVKTLLLNERLSFFKGYKNIIYPNLGKLGPNMPKFKVFGQLFKFESLNFSDFADSNRKTGYLTDNGCG